MRTFRLTAVLLLLVSFPLSAFCVDKGQTELSFAGGFGVPVGTFEDVAKLGFLFGANVGYYVSPQFALGVEGNYYRFPGSDELESEVELFLFLFTGVFFEVDIDWSVFQGTAYGKYLFVDQHFSPYIKGTVGYYNLKVSVAAFGEEESESEGNFGFGAGLGAQFQGEGNIGGFFEALFQDIFADGDDAQFIEVRGGINIFLGGGTN